MFDRLKRLAARAANAVKGAALAVVGTVGAVVVAGSQSAHAALPTGIATGLTGIQTDALDLVDLVWPVVLAVTGAFILFKLFKRVVGKV